MFPPVSKLIRRCLGLFFLLLISRIGLAQTPTAVKTTLADGVQVWKASPPREKPWFFVVFDQLTNALTRSRPFDKSVAFIVGISNYRHLQKLPFVANDVEDIKNYLITKGGFDEVFVALDGTATENLVRRYMLNQFLKLNERDRLLFYFSGHGADIPRGTTGYLQFGDAVPGDFSHDVLPVSTVLEWSSVIPANHILFLLDSCSSGLAFSAKNGSDIKNEAKLVQTLSGNGSRTVITAGTAEEETFEVPDRHGRGNGVFTRAFLNAVRNGRAGTSAFLTIDQVFADLKIAVGQFASEYHKQLHPHSWTFDESTYRGTFVFLNPAVRKGQVSKDQLRSLGATPKSGGEVSEFSEAAHRPDPPPSYVREKFALLIGIGRFKDPRIPSRQFSAKDAKDLAALLIDPNYGRFKPENVTLLTDETATRANILNALQELVLRTREDDMVVLFISSHGSPKQQGFSGAGYVATYDTMVRNIWVDGLDYEDLARWVSHLKPRRKVAFLDTSFSGQISTDSQTIKPEVSREATSDSGHLPSGSTTVNLRDPSDLSLSGEGTFVIASSQDNELSFESDVFKNSYFTHFLLEALRLDRNKPPNIKQLFEYLSENVTTAVASERGSSQHPQLHPAGTSADVRIGVLPRGDVKER